MRRLTEATQKPKTEQTDSDLQLNIVWNATKTMIYHCIYSMRDCVLRDWMTLSFWLNSNQKLNASQRPFTAKQHDATLEKYCEIWQRFICFCLRAMEDQDKVTSFQRNRETDLKFGCKFNKLQQLQLENLQSLLSENPDERELTTPLLIFSISFVKQSRYQREKSALIHFANIFDWNDRSNSWRQPNLYSSYLARILFCVKVIVFEHTLPLLLLFFVLILAPGCAHGFAYGERLHTLSFAAMLFPVLLFHSPSALLLLLLYSLRFCSILFAISTYFAVWFASLGFPKMAPRLILCGPILFLSHFLSLLYFLHSRR